MSNKLIAFVFGTRPEIIKLSPLIRLCAVQRRPFILIHSGQHYTPAMDGIFMKQLKLPAPQYRLNGRSKGAGLHAEHTGRLMAQIEQILIRRRPSHVVVQGDTNTVLAAALAAVKLPEIHVGHVEAGLRSFDRQMPEEINRILTDHMSHLLFAPTRGAADLLRHEGIDGKKIHMTGNTIVDALMQNIVIAHRFKKLNTRQDSGKPYALLTLHRQENVDSNTRLAAIFRGLEKTARVLGLEILFPAHPRTVARVKQARLKIPKGIRITEPVGYFDFLLLEESAKLILTDSGGVQEEACILRVPCVTLRTSTERPETVQAGGNIVAGHDPAHIVAAANSMINRPRGWKNPFGDGHACERILKIIHTDSSARTKE
jgi:UDP-N-acetylglucosamine 2-epimerase (non-hydrolysing)